MVVRNVRRERHWRYAAQTYLLIALGGMLGALARHGVTEAAAGAVGSAATGTFIANISGAFLLGYVSTVAVGKLPMSIELRRFIAVGILGSYTTFSVLSYQTLLMIESGNLVAAAANATGSLVAGLAAVMAGVKIART